MPSDKTELSTSNNLTIDNEQALAVANNSDESKTPPNKRSNASTQMQLLGLAKKFVIDGALLPTEKQLPIEERAIKRERITHLRNQQNIELIIQRALQYCSANEMSDKADQDWFNHFIQLAESVSNKTMQNLWAKILAGEISSPGSFSLKSLQAFKNMSIHEAKLLSKACAIAVKDTSRAGMRIISGASQTPGLFNVFSKNRIHRINLSAFGLSYAEMMTLADNHLIFLQETESPMMASGEGITFNFNGLSLTLQAAKKNTVLSFYKFTPIGTELAQLIGDNPDGQYLALLKQEIKHLFDIAH